MSSPPLRVFLNREEERTLWELSKAEMVTLRTRERAQVLRLSSQGWKVDKIAKYMKCNKETVRRTIHRWKEKGLGGLYSKKGGGRKKKWKDEDIQVIEDKLEKEERSYNSKQLCRILKSERNIEMSERQMRRILKKKNYVWKRTKTSLKNKQNQHKRAFKQADLEMLEWAASVGEIYLKYTDESGFTLWSGVQYTWAKRGKPKTIEQTKKRGKRLNVCGFFEKNIGFDYGLALKTMTSEEYITLIDWQAKKAEKRFKKTNKITVLVEDGAPIHTSHAVQAQQKKWEKQGLYLFQLPSYSPDLNEIENEWQRLKEDEIAGETFECEYDLVLAVIEAVEQRGKIQELKVDRFHFKQKKTSKKKVS